MALAFLRPASGYQSAGPLFRARFRLPQGNNRNYRFFWALRKVLRLPAISMLSVIRRNLYYPIIKADAGNRTLNRCLQGTSFTVELHRQKPPVGIEPTFTDYGSAFLPLEDGGIARL